MTRGGVSRYTFTRSRLPRVGDYQDKNNFASQQPRNPRHNTLLRRGRLQNASKCALAHCYKGVVRPWQFGSKSWQLAGGWPLLDIRCIWGWFDWNGSCSRVLFDGRARAATKQKFASSAIKKFLCGRSKPTGEEVTSGAARLDQGALKLFRPRRTNLPFSLHRPAPRHGNCCRNSRGEAHSIRAAGSPRPTPFPDLLAWRFVTTSYPHSNAAA
ncbi:hypothetical protein OKW29_002433 [Paraburkholderia sp. CI3]